MTRQRIAGGIALVAAVLWASSSFATGDIALFLGGKQLDDKEWDPVDSHSEIGMLLTIGKEPWPVQIAADLLISDQSEECEAGSMAPNCAGPPPDPLVDPTPIPAPGGVDVDVNTIELDLGVRKFWQVWKKRLRPFAAGGLSIIKIQGEKPVVVVGTDTDDFGVGGWVDGGILWQFHKRLSVGLEARWSSASAELFGNKVNAGGTHAGLILGWRL